MTSRSLKQGIGGEPLPVTAELSPEELLNEMKDNPFIIYTHKNKEFCPYKKGGINGYDELLKVQNEPQSYKIPSYIAYDKMVKLINNIYIIFIYIYYYIYK